MNSALLIVSSVAGFCALWAASRLWSDWEKAYRDTNQAPPPGGDSLGYVISIGGFLAGSLGSYWLLIKMG